MAFDESKATYKQIINRVKALKEELETGKALGQQDTERYKATQKEYQELTKKYELKSDINQLSKEEMELQNKITAEYTATQDEAKKLGDNIQRQIESIPVIGGALPKMLGLEDLGDQFAEAIVVPNADVGEGIKKNTVLQRIFNFVTSMNPIGLILVALTAMVGIYKFLVGGARDLGKELGIGAQQANDMRFNLMKAEASMKLMGFDSADLKLTMKATSNEFGDLSMMSVSASKDISMIAQNLGTSGENIVKINKALIDLTGMSMEAATNFSEMAAGLAAAANVSTARVIEDIAQNASKFAEFSMSGADGLAEAAVEAAKVGASLSMVLGVADKLLDFETSLTAQFEAQVLTGKNLNLERARQLSLEGDIAGLTTEIQKTVGSLGEIQSMNVIERRAIAEAIGLSADDLLKVARGEAVAEQETVQDKLDTTNKLLAAQESERKAILDATVKNNIGAGLVY